MSKIGLLFCVLSVSAVAQQSKAPTFDPRLGYSTIVREDLFSGFLAVGEKNDGARFLRGEQNLEILLTERPENRPGLTAWKAGIALKRAADANEAKRTGDFEREYRKALDLFAEAAKLGPQSVAVMVITGAGCALFADRLPEPYRREAWNIGYKAYSAAWQAQGLGIDQLPLHLKGELLAGLAQSAQRTDHPAESAEFVEKILATVPGTPYATAAKNGVDSPQVAARTTLTCQTCHEPGRLEARKASLASLGK